MKQCEKILNMSHDELTSLTEKIKPKLIHNNEVMRNIGRSYMNRVVDAWLLANRFLSLSFGFPHEKREEEIHDKLISEVNDKQIKNKRL